MTVTWRMADRSGSLIARRTSFNGPRQRPPEALAFEVRPTMELELRRLNDSLEVDYRR